MTAARKTYVTFVDLPNPGSDKLLTEVRTRRGEVLGGLQWYGPWAQYVFIPEEMTIFSHDCLEDIAAKIKELK